MFAQCSPTVGYTGILCNGQSIDFYIDFTQTNCGTVSNISWAFDPCAGLVSAFVGNKQYEQHGLSGAPVSLTITYASKGIYGTVSTPTQYYAIRLVSTIASMTIPPILRPASILRRPGTGVF